MKTNFLSLLSVATLACAYTWPSPLVDELEDIIYLQSGYLRRGFRDGILGCTFVPAGSQFRQASSEWLRTGFHDMITHDKDAGTGGIDASLMYELDRPENQGVVGLNDTFGFFFSFHNTRASMADLVAIGVYASVRECGGPVVPIKGGRIDASEAGPKGVPEPSTDLETTTERFAKAGFTTEDMIAMVACGHTLGGVHGNNHPEVTGNNSAADFPKFDSTTFEFDNNVVAEYLEGNTTNPLVVGPDATNSDKRVFNADKNVTMLALADPATFRTTCSSIFERMINTVPSSVTLTDIITPIDIKPAGLKVYLQNNTALHLEGAIRVRTTERTPPQSVSLPYLDQDGKSCETCTISTRPATFQGGSASGYDDSFKFYELSTDLPLNSSISSFTVEFSGETHDNNGSGGFPINTRLLHQPKQSCLVQKTDSNGNWNLTAVAAVRDDRASLPTHFEIAVKKFTPGIVGSRLDVQKVEMSQWKKAGESGFTLFSGSFAIPPESWSTSYDVVNGEGDDKVEVALIKTGSLPSECADWADLIDNAAD
ncbi:hypothetical protein VNI00_009272 [Paramarasmius palmivorus]|uniref:Peroxidase n=1 Tax=Paramarasmius palmivorus TaxID=297713 RepID=A0AAW0CSK2_9AGAR